MVPWCRRPQLKGPPDLWTVSPYPQLKGTHKSVDSESMSPSQGATQFVDYESVCPTTSGYITLPSQGPQGGEEWLHDPCRLGRPILGTKVMCGERAH